jgi:CheY-like chemotaxis protein
MKQHILIIDDDMDDIVIFNEALKKVSANEFKCTHAESVQHALEMLKYLQPDFIFVDYNMPQSNGIDFLESIAHDNRFANTKKFLLSTCISNVSMKKAIALGADGCIQKADSIEALCEILRDIFFSCLNHQGRNDSH